MQVSGELSNNGQPMRRFVQTFVLAPQSAKKYYVRNDIFRYQVLFVLNWSICLASNRFFKDDVFSDDEDAGDERPVENETDAQQTGVVSVMLSTVSPLLFTQLMLFHTSLR